MFSVRCHVEDGRQEIGFQERKLRMRFIDFILI